MKFVWTLLAMGLFVGALTLGWNFRALNEALIDIDLIWIQLVGIELWRVLLAALALGAGLILLPLMLLWLRTKMVSNRYRKLVRKLEKEVHELRSLPLVGSDPNGAALDLETAPGPKTPAPQKA